MVTWKISNLLVVIIALLIGVSLYRSRSEDASNDEGIKICHSPKIHCCQQS